jgi:small-conductance mechanosensitive channel
MLEFLREWFPSPDSFEGHLLRGTLTFFFTTLTARVLTWIIWRVKRSNLILTNSQMSVSRQNTLRSLISSLLNALAILITVIVVLSMFIQPSVLVTSLGLFSAGLGIAARPFISDFLGGVVLLFEDQFALGDKVEIGDKNVMGVVEKVSLRTTYIRGENGELWIVPNGDVRTLRNFTRGSYSPANINLTVPTNKLDETLALLSQLSAEPGPDVIETPEIISEDGSIGTSTTLLFKVKAKYGHGPVVRRRLLERLQILLIEHGIIEDPDDVSSSMNGGK